MRIVIDPGTSGGIVVETFEGTVHAFSMPKTDMDKIDLFRRIKGMRQPGELAEAWKERVGGFAGGRKVTTMVTCVHCKRQFPYVQVQGDPGSRMFNFGDGNGFVRCLLLVIGCRYNKEIAPRSWQKVFNVIRDKRESTTAWKNRLKDLAMKKFPGIQVTLKTADALLMLEYVRMGGR